VSTHLPRIKERAGFADAFAAALGSSLLGTKTHVGEISFTVARDAIAEACRIARDQFGYQQLMEIAGADYPERPERFEVNYHLLSITENHRVRLKVSTDGASAVPSVTSLWPVAGWLEREVFDLYGVPFSGNSDLRRILTDYNFEGHPLRKDFPLTGYVEMRYSEAEKRVVYEPVQLAQDWRKFDFLMPWEGPEYRLPGDEKAAPQAPGAPSPAPASIDPPKVLPTTPTDKREGGKPYTTDNEDRTLTGADQAAREARKPASEKAASVGGKPISTPDSKSPAKTRAKRKSPDGGEA
jgi:NADH-quinone oxidoreductase subunit C